MVAKEIWIKRTLMMILLGLLIISGVFMIWIFCRFVSLGRSIS